MLTKTRLWSGLTAIFAVLLVFLIVGGSVANFYAGYINSALNVETSKVVSSDDSNTDTTYYKTSVGDKTFSEANLSKLFEMTTAQNVAEMEEGAALLYNKNSALPLKTTEKRVSVFGHAAVDPAYQSSSAGTKVSESYQYTVTFDEALKTEGFAINESLWSALEAGTASRGVAKEQWGSIVTVVNGSAKGSEENLAFYNAQKSTYATDYNEVAIVMFARQGAEGTDLKMQDDDDEGGASGKISSLALHKNEKDLLNLVRNDFSKVIVLLNSPNQMEVEEIVPYCDAILYIGFPGHQGFTGVARILDGKVNPSGHLVDTYAVDSLSAPACVNSGTETPDFANVDAINNTIGAAQRGEKISVQVENIYIGYRYYETRYADCVEKQGDASDKVGAVDGATAWKYQDEVSYTFGHGLSYTTFEQKLDSVAWGEDTVTVKVTVKNAGAVAGKSVVQVYAQTPYGDYEIQNKVEKSAIQLAGYGKTKLLAAGESQQITVTIDKYLLASYDSNSAKGYILSEGDYYIAIGDDAHDALNNVLAAKGYSVSDGMTSAGVAAKANKKTLAFDSSKYEKGENGVVVTNQFQDRDLNSWIDGAAIYITRSDWKGTYPTQQTTVNATAEMMTQLANKTYVKSQTAKTYDEVANKFQGLSADKITLTLPMMRGVAITDPLWRTFIYQLSVDDVANATVESFTCPAVGSLSPSFVVGDGCDSIGGTIRIYTTSGTIYAANSEDTVKTSIATLRYCSNPIYTGTFNAEIQANRGTCLGEDSLWSKQMCAYNTGLDLHRTPFGGRSFEYMSECPTMSYLCSIYQVEAMEKTGAHAAPKHFCGNDQETYRDGVACFTTEQAFREGDLRAFEGAIRVAKAGALMQSFERTGMVWASYDYALNTQVLRNEWGWTGSIDTDASPMRSVDSEGTGLRFHSPEGFMAGTNQWCLDSVNGHGKSALAIAKETNDGDLLEKVVESAIYWEYAIANSNIINGMAPGDLIVPVTPWWQVAITTLTAVMAVLAAGCLALTIVGNVKKKEK